MPPGIVGIVVMIVLVNNITELDLVHLPLTLLNLATLTHVELRTWHTLGVVHRRGHLYFEMASSIVLFIYAGSLFLWLLISSSELCL